MFCLQSHERDAGDAGKCRIAIPMVDCLCLLPGIGADQLTGRRRGFHVAIGLQTGHSRSCASRCAALCLWLFLHPQLSE